MSRQRCVLLVALSLVIFQACPVDAQEQPVFSSTGPNADEYGQRLGYPVGLPFNAPQNMVGNYSHKSPFGPTHTVAASEKPSLLLRAPTELPLSYTFNDTYSFASSTASLADYLTREPATGLLIAHDQTILYEHYQYGRTDHDLLLSQSMAKTITAMLIGIAISEGEIHSVDDTAQIYVPELNGTEIGKTPIRALLHMASGIEFTQDFQGADEVASDDHLLNHLLRMKDKVSTTEAVSRFNRRIAPPDTHWHYSNLDAVVLGLVVTHATHMTMSQYLQTRIWQPMGAEASAAWELDTSGQEFGNGGFSATLRDYARFGLLLAHDGAWDGRQIIPRQWLLDATQPVEKGSFLALTRGDHPWGYGYLTWLLPGPPRMFFLVGVRGQAIMIDPASHLVLVQTAVEEGTKDMDQTELFQIWNAAVKLVSKN